MASRGTWATVVLLAMVALLVATCPVGCGSRKAYPEKPIEFVVPFGAGGGSDILARSIAATFEEERILPVKLVVVNKPGGSGAVGYSYLAEKKGDPYYIAPVTSSFWTTPILGNSPVSYKDFTPIVGLVTDELVMLVRHDSPYKTVADVLAVLKGQPRSVSVGGTSMASDDRVVTYLLERAAGVEFKFVPFKSGGEVMANLLGGHIDVAWANPGEALAQLEAGMARPLATASQARLSGLPDVPTLRELGYDVVFQDYRGIVAPAAIPSDAVAVLEKAFEKLVNSDSWRKAYVEKNMTTLRFARSEEWAKAVERRDQLYREVFKELGVIK